MNEKKILSNAKNVTLVFAVIYIIVTVLAAISIIGNIENDSTTKIGFQNVLSIIWFQLLVIAFFALTSYMYGKKGKLGVIFELIIGVALLLNVIINLLISNTFSTLTILNFAFPVIVLLHGMKVLISLYKEKQGDDDKKLFNIK